MYEFTKEVVAGECVLERTEEAVGAARRFLAERFAGWGIVDDFDGRLIVSELVTNALVHGNGPIVLRVFQDERDGLPVIEVQDDGVGRPLIQAENHAAIGGRGLLMVACLARDWGVRALAEGGKVAWAKCGI
ncbi:ATP-binding protein [Actinomadura sp. 3N508]|uniref:ATP-binding protein n=1 Tax=Actinomadura sp. 3N508 TaxID=3375153 RepID=UPI00378E94F6